MFPDQDGDLPQTGPLGGPPPSFPNDYLVPAVLRDDHDGLDNPGFLDGLGQFLDALVIESGPRLGRIRGNLVDIQLGEPFFLDYSEFLRDKGRQAFSQRFFVHLLMISSARLK